MMELSREMMVAKRAGWKDFPMVLRTVAETAFEAAAKKVGVSVAMKGGR